MYADVAIAAVADVDRAVRVAKGVFDRTWGALAGYERAKYLFRLFRLVGEHSRSLAVLESLNCGRPIRLTRAEVSQVGAYLFHYAGWADKLPYAGLGPRPRPLGVVGRHHSNRPLLAAATPLGVVGQVVSWKAPLLALARTVAPALARGNTVVLAPAETTPLSALRFADLCHHAGLPPGVVNVVTGGAEAKAALVTHPRVDKVAVVGPAEVNAAAAAAGLNVPLGGAVTIVFDDAPFDQAVEGIVDTAFRGVDHGWSGAPLPRPGIPPPRAGDRAAATNGAAAGRRSARPTHRRGGGRLGSTAHASPATGHRCPGGARHGPGHPRTTCQTGVTGSRPRSSPTSVPPIRSLERTCRGRCCQS